jgi:membrane protein implicated in regulation of membrane protease activity
MFWMAILMAFPLLGLSLFWLLPWKIALVPYLFLVAVSLFFDSLMMNAMRTPIQDRFHDMIGATAVVYKWRGDQGQVVWKDEFWLAHTNDGRSLVTGERVVIESVSGLTLTVRPFGSALHGNNSQVA